CGGRRDRNPGLLRERNPPQRRGPVLAVQVHHRRGAPPHRRLSLPPKAKPIGRLAALTPGGFWTVCSHEAPRMSLTLQVHRGAHLFRPPSPVVPARVPTRRRS